MDTKTLKIDDKVLIVTPRSWGPNQYDTATVAKVTPSGRVTTKINEWECEFNPDGRQRGEKYYVKQIVPFDQSLLDQQAHHTQMGKNRRRLKEVRWDVQDESLVLKVIELLDAAEKQATV